MKKQHNIMISLENIAILKEWSGVFPLGSLTVVRGRNSSGKTVIGRALVAGYRPTELARAAHKAGELQDIYLLAAGSEAGEVRIREERGERVVSMRKGSRPTVAAAFPGEERIGLMDVKATIAMMRQKGFALADLGVSMLAMKATLRASAKVKKRMAERGKVVALEAGLRRKITEYDQIIATMMKKWGAARDYINALLAVEKIPPSRYDESDGTDEMDRDEYDEANKRLMGRIRLYKLGAESLADAIEAGTEQEIACPCCKDIISAAEARESVERCKAEQKAARAELDRLREAQSRQCGRRNERQNAEWLRDRVPVARKKLGIKRSKAFDAFNPAQLAGLLHRFSLPAPHKLVTDGEIEAATARMERAERLATADPSAEINRYLQAAQDLGLTGFSRYRDGQVSADGTSWWPVRGLSRRDLAVVAVCVAAACRTVYESAAPLLVADSLLTGADELKFLDQIARDQRIAVIATVADEGQLRM